MAHRSPRIRSTHRQRIWPSLLLLLVAVIVPTACVLWFMSEAMRNERLAVRQKLTAVYQGQLLAIERRLQSFWQAKEAALASVDAGAAASEIFARLVRTGVADSVIVYDSSGQVRYPADPKLYANNIGADESEAWLGAWQLEFERTDILAAASVYAEVARDTVDMSLAARALRAQARCLVKADQVPWAVKILTSDLADPKYRNATDTRGSLIVPNGQLLALQLIDDPSAAEYRSTLAHLVQRITDYSDSFLPASQRAFLMEQLRPIVTNGGEFPTFEAETLAADYLDSDPLAVQAGIVQRTAIPGVWQLVSADRTIAALFREERLRWELQSLVEADFSIPDATVTVVPSGLEAPQPAPFLTQSAGEYLADWKLGLTLTGPDPFRAMADRRIAVYLWTGVLVVVVIATLAGFVAHYVGVQMRLTRLKNDLIATVSHELKTPLSSIRALADTLLEGRYRDREQAQEYLELIAKENERLSRVIDDFLAFSRMERNKRAFEFDEVRIDIIVDAALDAVRERFGSPRLRPEVEIAPGLPAISADADALTTVLINLLDNAYKYTGNDKRVVVRAYPVNGNVRLEVEDNGIGLSRRAVKRVFNRFYQADQSLSRGGGGCGLGLSIVRFIVTAHGGSVTVASQPGQGSTFAVTLPVRGAVRTAQH